MLDNLKIALDWLEEKAQSNDTAKRIVETISEQSFNHSKPDSLKSWLSNFDIVETLQITIRDYQVVKVWHAGIREVDTSRATYATFNGSRRDYTGTISISSARDVLIAFDKDTDTYIIYNSAV